MMKATTIGKVCIAVLTVFFLATGAYACEGKGKHDPEKAALKQTEWMQANLELTSDQLASVTEINMRYAAQRQAIFTGNKRDRASVRQQMESLRGEHRAELQGVLSNEQFAEFEQAAETRKQGRKGKGKRG